MAFWLSSSTSELRKNQYLLWIFTFYSGVQFPTVQAHLHLLLYLT